MSAFLFLQVSGQFGVFTGGVNTYTLVASFDVYTHALGAAVLGALLLQYITLSRKYDLLWRFWVPFQVAVVGAAWELIELIITWFGLLPPTQMWATIENSIQDVFVDFLGVCAVSFLYELMEENKAGSRGVPP
ncbi:hypothetical protein KEJ39_04180 [Candidatus Bathyarchaeota archaeon]|nr:hypothetical protein [Candidatus Bathyarchaeota archaeon]